MFTFMKDLFVWLFKKILFFFFPMVGWIVWFFENFPDTAKNILEWIISHVKWYFTDFYLWFFGKLTEMITTFFADNDFIVGVAEMSNDTFLAINVFLPLNETFVCVTLILSTMLSVFLIRIVLKAIPTVW